MSNCRVCNKIIGMCDNICESKKCHDKNLLFNSKDNKLYQIKEDEESIALDKYNESKRKLIIEFEMKGLM